MKGGCEAAPTNRSVSAKQASKMLYLLCSLGLVFTPNYHQKRNNLRTMKVRDFRLSSHILRQTFDSFESQLLLFSCRLIDKDFLHLGLFSSIHLKSVFQDPPFAIKICAVRKKDGI